MIWRATSLSDRKLLLNFGLCCMRFKKSQFQWLLWTEGVFNSLWWATVWKWHYIIYYIYVFYIFTGKTRELRGRRIMSPTTLLDCYLIDRRGLKWAPNKTSDDSLVFVHWDSECVWDYSQSLNNLKQRPCPAASLHTSWPHDCIGVIDPDGPLSRKSDLINRLSLH